MEKYKIHNTTVLVIKNHHNIYRYVFEYIEQ